MRDNGSIAVYSDEVGVVHRCLEKPLILGNHVVGETESRLIEAVQPYSCVVDFNTAVVRTGVGDDRLAGELGWERLPEWEGEEEGRCLRAHRREQEIDKEEEEGEADEKEEAEDRCVQAPHRREQGIGEEVAEEEEV